MPRFLLLLYFAFSAWPLIGQIVTIHGQAKDYAGKELIFYTYPEPISHRQQRLAETRIGQDGIFNLSFNAGQTIEIYTDLEKFRGTLVVEPGSHYEISLPAYSPRTTREAASPYFEPDLYWLGIKGTKPSELNFLVRAFLTDYNKELSIHTLDLYQKKSVDTARIIIARLEKNYPAGKNFYLNTLKTYSCGKIEYVINQPDKERIAHKFFATKEVILSHPAYQHLFNAIFTDYLTTKSQDIKHKEFISPARHGDFEGWVKTLMSSGYQKEPAELLAAKSFYDGFFSNKFDKEAMLKGLKEAVIHCTFPPLKASLPGIVQKITSLQEGNPAPALSLKKQNEETTLLHANGKFLYLAFFKSDSKDSKAELDSLVSIAKKLNNVLTVVPVSLDKNFLDAVKLWKEKKYPWELTCAVDADKACSDYQIKIVPTFYLIAPDQKLLLSPALAPTHNFEALFLKIYRESRFMQQRR